MKDGKMWGFIGARTKNPFDISPECGILLAYMKTETPDTSTPTNPPVSCGVTYIYAFRQIGNQWPGLVWAAHPEDLNHIDAPSGFERVRLTVEPI